METKEELKIICAERLNKILEVTGLSPATVSILTGISETRLHQLLTGTGSLMFVDELISISKGLLVSCDYVIGSSDKMLLP